jgi:hypothetical protein
MKASPPPSFPHDPQKTKRSSLCTIRAPSEKRTGGMEAFKKTLEQWRVPQQERAPLPEEVQDVEEFVKLSERAAICEIKRLRDVVKLKLRTAKRLYTLKIDPPEAEQITKRLKCRVVEA